jgi:tetratricopeptide (TPR) repeat protein
MLSLETAHLSEETLAILAEQGARGSGDERSLQHLARCRSCLAAYADAVRYRTAWLAAPELFAPSGVSSAPNVSVKSRVRRAGPWAAAAALLLAVGLGAPLLHRAKAPVQPAGPIAALLENASATDLVYLGGERGAASRPLRYRAGGEDRAADSAIEALRQRYEANAARSLSDLYALAAALTAAGRTDLAHDYVQEGRALAPEHPGFLLLAAVLANRERDPQRADQLMREARALAPDDATLMLDHAILLQESGSSGEAAALLQQVIRRAPGSALASRAERLLATAR